MKRSAEGDAERIQVDVRDGKVILSGAVHASFEWEEAEKAARLVGGVTDVENRITHSDQVMLRHNIGAVPICDQDNKLLGIITDRDLAIECCTSDVDARHAPVVDFMTTNPITTHPDTVLKEACELMAKAQVRRLPVVDNSGKLLGIVSLGDLAACMPHEQAVLDALARISVPSQVQQQTVLQERAAGT